MSNDDFEIYIHIPFCVKKCNYCDFLSFVCSDETISDYVRALNTEIGLRGKPYSGRRVTSIYIGGGTPSSIRTRHIIDIMDNVDRTFTIDPDSEITIECNPGTVSKEALSVYKSLGINRLSFGLQSTNTDELGLLGRIHDYNSFITSLDNALSLGYDNISCDLIYGLPGQSLKSLRKTLSDVAKFNLKHISAYSLIIEEGTPFYDRYYEDSIIQSTGGITSFLPSEDEIVDMSELVGAYLGNRGYNRYEISNYARRGYECRHNIGYWKRNEYIGFGLGAASLLGSVRYTNTRALDAYMNNFTKTNPSIEYDEVCKLTVDDEMAEYMMLGLRMTNGVSVMSFYNTFHRTLDEVYGKQLSELVADGLITVDGGVIRPTSHGLMLQNRVAGKFLG